MPEMKNLANYKTKDLFFLLLASLLFISGCVYVYQFFIDDTFISLRYAKNLVDHGKLSFNPGEPPIEGYTNFLLVLIEALFIKMGVSGVVHIPKVIGIISGLGAIFLTYKISSRIMPQADSWVRCLPVLATAVSSPLIVWAVGGLESDLFLMLILGGVYYFICNLDTKNVKDAILSDVFFFLALLCRPDAILIWGLGYLFLLFIFRQVNWRGKLYGMVMSAFLLGCYLLWKYYYFGDLLPTTFYAKTQPFGLDVIDSGLYLYGLFIKLNLNPVYFLLIFAAIWSLGKRTSHAITYLLLLFFVYSAYVISLGAPAMNQGFRFLIPVVPALFIIGTYGLVYLIKTVQGKKFLIGLVSIIYMLQIGMGVYDLFRLNNIDFGWILMGRAVGMKEVTKISEESCALGQWMGQRLKPGSSIAIGDIGGTGYYSNMHIIDTWSILDKRIIELRGQQAQWPFGTAGYAQVEKQIAGYVLDKNPELIRLEYVDLALDPRSDKYILIDNPVDKLGYMFFIREDLLEKGEEEGKRLSAFKRTPGL